MSALPKGWTLKPLGEVATLQRGFDLPVQRRSEGDYKIFAANGPVGTHDQFKVKGPGVVTGRSGTLGKVHYVNDDYWPLNTALWVKDFHNNDPLWISRLLRWMRLERFTRGAGVPTLNRNLVHVEEVPLPPLDEQKRIAAILDAADALWAKRRESLDQLDALVQSTFLDMFGDPNPDWPRKTVSDLARSEKGSIRTGPFGSQLLHSEFVASGIRVLGIDNVVANEFRDGEPRFITPEKYEQLKRYTVRPGDVLITIMGTCGRCAVVPDDIDTAINTKHLCCITLDRTKCQPSFLHAFFLRHPEAERYLKRHSKGAIMAGLNMGIIKRLPITLPPLRLQNQFAEIVEAIERQKARLQNHLGELDDLFACLQQRAFAGEL